MGEGHLIKLSPSFLRSTIRSKGQPKYSYRGWYRQRGHRILLSVLRLEDLRPSVYEYLNVLLRTSRSRNLSLTFLLNLPSAVELGFEVGVKSHHELISVPIDARSQHSIIEMQEIFDWCETNRWDTVRQSPGVHLLLQACVHSFIALVGCLKLGGKLITLSGEDLTDLQISICGRNFQQTGVV